MENSEKIEDLENIVAKLSELIDETENEYYIGCLKELIEDVKIDLDKEKRKQEEIISEEYKADLDYKNREYRKMQGF